MAVVIDELESIVEGGGEPAATPPAAGGAPNPPGLDDDGFRLKYGRVVRELVREELERQRRVRAD